MKTYRWIIFVLVVLSVGLPCWPAGSVFAQEPSAANTDDPNEADGSPSRGFQIALFKPFQIYDPETAISGFRWNLIYGDNRAVSGLDVGTVNVVAETFKGLQIGGYNSAGTAEGLQLGMLNTAQQSRTVQIGIINHANEMNGIQIGLFYNTADTLKGVQVGLFNFIWNRKPMFFFPFFNMAF